MVAQGREQNVKFELNVNIEVTQGRGWGILGSGESGPMQMLLLGGNLIQLIHCSPLGSTWH